MCIFDYLLLLYILKWAVVNVILVFLTRRTDCFIEFSFVLVFLSAFVREINAYINVVRPPVVTVRRWSTEAGGGNRHKGSRRQEALGDQVPRVIQQRQSTMAFLLTQPQPQHRHGIVRHSSNKLF